MSQRIEFRGTIDKVTRANGKPGAQIMVTVPAANASDVPLGSVSITFEATQGSLDLGKQKPAPGKQVRGDRG